jgi:uncharacterized protein
MPDDPTKPDADTTAAETPRAEKRRGFAAMDPKLVREIARKGGKAAHMVGTAHEFTCEEARIAGRAGGKAVHAKRRAAASESNSSASPDVNPKPENEVP